MSGQQPLAAEPLRGVLLCPEIHREVDIPNSPFPVVIDMCQCAVGESVSQ